MLRHLVVILVCALLPGMATAARDGSPTRAPAWSLQTAEGETVRFPEAAEGQPTVLLFWPSWCPYSRALQPYVQAIWEDYRDAGVKVWAINLREREDVDPAQVLRERGLSLPLLVKGDALMLGYRIERSPWLVVIDDDQRIVYTRPSNPPSPIDVARDTRQALNALLGDRAVPLPESWPPPYDLHLRDGAEPAVRTISGREWNTWVKQTLADIDAAEVVADIPPQGRADDGVAVIERAREIWFQRYGEAAVRARAPYRSFRQGGTWVVVSTGQASDPGDGYLLIMERDSGRVLRVSEPPEPPHPAGAP
jgi:thiol-disulfide isomerase/thioredoxin